MYGSGAWFHDLAVVKAVARWWRPERIVFLKDAAPIDQERYGQLVLELERRRARIEALERHLLKATVKLTAIDNEVIRVLEEILATGIEPNGVLGYISRLAREGLEP